METKDLYSELDSYMLILRRKKKRKEKVYLLCIQVFSSVGIFLFWDKEKRIKKVAFLILD